MIYCFLSGMNSYIDGTKNLANMRKQLRFQLPRTPLKVLRGEQDEEDIRDKYHERFQAPGTTTEDAEDYRDIDDESRRSSVSHEYVLSDIDEVSDEGMARYLGRDTSSIESIDSNSHEKLDDPKNVDIALKDDTTGSVNKQIADDDNYKDSDGDTNRSSLQLDVVSETNDDNDDNPDVNSDTSSLQRHGTRATRDDGTHDNDNDDNHDIDIDNASRGEARHLDNDDIDANTGYQTTGSVSEEAIELQVMGQVHQPPNTDTDKEDELSRDDSHAL